MSNSFDGVVYNKRYVLYDNDGNVFGIEGIPDETNNVFEIDIDLIPNFMEGIKDPTKYTIDYFTNISNGVITDDDDDEVEESKKIQHILHEISKTDNLLYDILIDHNATSKEWTFSLNKSNITRTETMTNIPMYVTMKDNHNLLLSTYIVDIKDLVTNGSVSFNFNTETEVNLEDISLLTTRSFKYYKLQES